MTAACFRLPPPTGHGFDRRVKAEIAEWLVLVERQANVPNGLLIQFTPEQAAVGDVPRLFILPKLQVERMCYYVLAGLPEGILPITTLFRPREIS